MDGTLLEAWASLKSFHPKDEGKPPTGGEKNPSVDFHGQTRSNDTHQSTTDAESLLAKKGSGKEAKSPEGCLELREPNDYTLIIDKIDAYRNKKS